MAATKKKKEEDSEELLSKWRKRFNRISKLRDKNQFHFRYMKKMKQSLIPQYKNIVKKHLIEYRDEFKTYFSDSTHNLPIISFDIEEYYNEILCIMTIKLYPDSHFDVRIDLFRNWPKERRTKKVLAKFKHWLKKQEKCVLIIHGKNKNEMSLIEDVKHDVANTQDMLAKAIQKNKFPLEKTGLGSFEKMINFERVGCKMLKHKKELPKSEGGNFIRYFFNQCLLSIHFHNEGEQQLSCFKTGKKQDVLLYCLEDAFVTLLAYVKTENKMG